MKPTIAIVLVSGFRESERASSGTERLHALLSEAYWHLAKVYDLRAWDHDMEGLAAKMLRDGIHEAILIGYSWGGGFGIQRLSRELEKLTISVPLMLTCDAVYRPLWLSTKLPANILALRSVLPGSARIVISGNVRRIAGVYQTRTIPKGHAWKLGPNTQAGPFRKLISGHREIDEDPGWYKLVGDEIDSLFRTRGQK